MAVDYCDIELMNMVDKWSSPLSTMMLIGDVGCGKMNLCKYISQKFNLELFDITDELTLERINDIYASVKPSLYVINTSHISVKEQNTILKFIEEPLKNSYTVLICSNPNYVLDTIKNRCITYTVKQLSAEELSRYSNGVDTELKVRLASTVGQMENLNSINVQEMYEYAQKVIFKIGKANLPNALLNIPNKIAFKDEQNKFTLNLFCKSLLLVCVEQLSAEPTELNYRFYEVTQKLYNDIQIPNVKTQNIFENYLISLKRLTQ